MLIYEISFRLSNNTCNIPFIIVIMIFNKVEKPNITLCLIENKILNTYVKNVFWMRDF